VKKVPARLLTELQEVRNISEVEGRLLIGITDLFGELATEERRRRQAWEEKTERNTRELRAGVDAELARSACEARRLLAEAKKKMQLKPGDWHNRAWICSPLWIRMRCHPNLLR